jgi:3-dehydroquinate dehydratase-2
LKILVINGPNLNLLGRREPAVYGAATLADIEAKLRQIAAQQNLELTFKQSNREGELVDFIQATLDDGTEGILINPGAYGHTSIAMRDALLAVGKPFVEVHVSNVYGREAYRKESMLTDIAVGIVAGFGPLSYELGLTALKKNLAGK